jgi:hypothetical protein
MKLFFLSMIVCLALLTLTTWLVVTPAYAANATAECGPGGSPISCSGTQCSSVDASPSGGGSCSCLLSNGNYETKTCNYKDAPAPVGPPEN